MYQLHPRKKNDKQANPVKVIWDADFYKTYFPKQLSQTSQRFSKHKNPLRTRTKLPCLTWLKGHFKTISIRMACVFCVTIQMVNNDGTRHVKTCTIEYRLYVMCFCVEFSRWYFWIYQKAIVTSRVIWFKRIEGLLCDFCLK